MGTVCDSKLKARLPGLGNLDSVSKNGQACRGSLRQDLFVTPGDKIIHRLLRLQFSGLVYANETTGDLSGTVQEAAG